MMVKGTARRLFCPKCGWSNIRSSEPVGLLDWAAKFAGLSPLRCRSCRLRFYRPWFLAKRASPLVTARRSNSASAVASRDTRVSVTSQEANPVSVFPQGAILLLDDDSASRKLLRRLLDREGYMVREASDSSAALAELRGAEMDLAIVNLNGHEYKTVVRTLRSAHPDLIVVVLSETVSSEEKSEKMVILPKPSQALAFLQNIRHLMSQERRREITHNI